MTSFDLRDNPVPPYSGALGMQDLNGLLRVHIKQRAQRIAGICFTEIDQAFVIWGLLASSFSLWLNGLR